MDMNADRRRDEAAHRAWWVCFAVVLGAAYTLAAIALLRMGLHPLG